MPCMPFVRIALKIKYTSVYRKILMNKVFKFKTHSPTRPTTIKSYISLKLFKNYPRLCKLYSYFTKNRVKTFFSVCHIVKWKITFPPLIPFFKWNSINLALEINISSYTVQFPAFPSISKHFQAFLCDFGW